MQNLRRQHICERSARRSPILRTMEMQMGRHSKGALNERLTDERRHSRWMLDHLNRRYGGNFVTDNFRYRSRYESRMRRNEVRIESLLDQTVTLAALGVTVSLRAGELIDAEVMWKFDPEELASILDCAGFSMVRRWIEPTSRYGLF